MGWWAVGMGFCWREGLREEGEEGGVLGGEEREKEETVQ